MSEKDPAEFYANPGNRRIVGPARRRTEKQPLSIHVPIRFSPTTTAWVRAFAARDGITLSSWVRAVVEREVQRRMPAWTGVATYEVRTSLEKFAPIPPGSTRNRTYEPSSELELIG